MQPLGRTSESPWGYAVVALWWSLPFGVVEGLRVALEGATFNSIFSEDHWLRCFAAGALVVLIDGLCVATVSLVAGLVARKLGRWSPLPWPRAQQLATAVFLQLALVVLLVQWGHRSPTAALTLACAAAWAMFLLWLAQGGIRPWVGRLALAGAFFGAQLAFFICYRLLSIQLIITLSKSDVVLISGLGGALTWLFWRRPLPAIAGGSAILAGIALWGTALPTIRGAEPGKDGEGIPILLITVDTLRRDAVSSYGSARSSTPNIDRLAEDGVTFERAYAPSPWTRPSIFSLLTSRYPHELPSEQPERGAPSPFQTLPALVSRKAPSRTVLTNFLGSYFGIRRDFEAVEAGDFESLARFSFRGTVLSALLERRSSRRLYYSMGTAEKVSDRALRHLEVLAGSGFFLWLHYSDPHAPYDPPTSTDQRREEVRKVLGSSASSWHSGDLRAGHMTSRREREVLRSQYDEEVRYTDLEIGRIFDFLVREDLWDQALIAFASDHGEEFWEHGFAGHGHTLYQELLQIPLLIKFPRGDFRGRRIAEPVGLMDLMPTLLDYLEYPQPPEGELRGRSLIPLLRGEPLEPRSLYFEGLTFYGEKKASLEWPWKLIYDPVEDRVELYQVAEDPLEQNNRAWDEASRAERMQRSIMVELEINTQSPPIDQEERARLRALGYLP